MKTPAHSKILLLLLISLFTPFAMADNDSALLEIADILSGINHFPSDADKSRLMVIAQDDSLVQGVRDMATTVSAIQHFPNDAGKQAMADIMANTQAPEKAKTVASIIANFAHMVNAEDKARLAAIE